MMKVLVISDTHRNIRNVIDILKRVQGMGVMALIHCGDHRDDAANIKKLYPGIEVYAVCGNCDSGSYGEASAKIISIEGASIFITHGHRYGIKWGDYSDLLIDAEAHEAQIAICGHSHSAYLEKKQGIILLNPGSISEPRDSMYPSYAVLDIEKGLIKNVSVMQILDGARVCTHPASNIYKKK